MDKQTKTEYKIHYGALGKTHDTDLKKFEGQVANLLNEGFKLQGAPVIAGNFIYQAMTKG
jgi:hypothetical protein